MHLRANCGGAREILQDDAAIVDLSELTTVTSSCRVEMLKYSVN